MAGMICSIAEIVRERLAGVSIAMLIRQMVPLMKVKTGVGIIFLIVTQPLLVFTAATSMVMGHKTSSIVGTAMVPSCWRVHLGQSNNLGAGEDWGNGYYGSQISLLIGLQVNDFNGDGRDDLLYRGKCGNTGVHCWRMHLSNGAGFNTPVGW